MNPLKLETPQAFLEDVRSLMVATVASTSLGFVTRESENVLAGGKMLRSRLAWRLGRAGKTERKTLVYAAAAVEMIHAASLLHDDVIDGGILRRNLPTFWVQRGASAAILLGDLLLFKGIDLICQVEQGRLTQDLVRLTGEVCEAESEQEIVFQDKPSTIDLCESIARRKTGALFAFAALSAGGRDMALTAALREAGYRIGAAYQLADDVLDATGKTESAGKTLGTDGARHIPSAADIDGDGARAALARMEQLRKDAIDLLAAWPDLQECLRDYIEKDLEPALQQLLSCAS